jgi:transposase InsO family protein
MSKASLLWGSTRIIGERRKVGIDVAKSTVEKHMHRSRKPPSPRWRAFLANHLHDLVSIDFFIVPTLRFRVLFVLIVLVHHRRRVVRFSVTQRPTAEWTGQQIINAFPWDEAPRYLLRDRDGIYGAEFRKRVSDLGIEEVLIAPRSPWQNPFAERIIGTIRRDCLDHVIVLGEHHLMRVLRRYFSYYHSWRPHLSLDLDCPDPRAVESTDHREEVVDAPEVGGLHHHYERRAA